MVRVFNVPRTKAKAMGAVLAAPKFTSFKRLSLYAIGLIMMLSKISLREFVSRVGEAHGNGQTFRH